jgi:hypothetical protein
MDEMVVVGLLGWFCNSVLNSMSLGSTHSSVDACSSLAFDLHLMIDWDSVVLP